MKIDKPLIIYSVLAIKSVIILYWFSTGRGIKSAENEIDLSSIKGIELFLLKEVCRNETSYNSYKTIDERKAFIDSYESPSNIPDEKCAFYVDLDNCKTENEPLLEKTDINKFDWESSKIYLKESGIKKLSEFKDISLIGTGFVIKINGQNVYGGWLWNTVSSFGCDRVWTFHIPKDGQLQLNFGLGGFECGTDPRKDEKRIQKAIGSGK